MVLAREAQHGGLSPGKKEILRRVAPLDDGQLRSGEKAAITVTVIDPQIRPFAA
jgi:hypothetical protein